MSRPTIVAVHGNGGGGERFARTAAAVPDGVAFHAVTLPGFGGVPRDPSLRTLPDYADRLGEMVATAAPAGPPPVVLGHGIGGSIALDLASRRPELLGGLVLHAPVGADLDTRLFPRVMRTPAVREAVRRLIAARPLRPVWRRAFFPHGAPAADLDRFFEGYRRCAVFGDMFELIDASWFEGLAPVEGVPAVLLWGEGDRVLRSGQVPAIRAKVPEATVVVVPGWDHFPMIEQPDDYAREVVAIAERLVGAGR